MNTQRFRDDVSFVWELTKIVIPILVHTYATASSIALCFINPPAGIPLTIFILGCFFYRRYVRSES